MSRKRKLVAIIVSLAACLGLAALSAGPLAAAGPQFKWLCKPGRANDPCTGKAGSLLTARVTANGEVTRSSPKTFTRLRKKVDCFYVYPTVSGQPGPNATLARDPEIEGIAVQQAARFAPGCRMFAPVYRQFTITAILQQKITDESSDIAYRSVKAAWNRYLRKFNRGRGIVLIGHSQGAGHLTRLIGETFDRRPKLRKRLVSAVLIGGNVVVRKGKRAGGSFRKVPACTKARQLGCVIAYSSFLEDPPPEDALFGRLGGALSDPAFSSGKYEVLCVNPARLDGSKGRLKPLYNTDPFPGMYGPMLPDLSGYEAPWVNFPGLYRASCAKAEGASWLRIRDISDPSDPRPRVGEPLGRAWGTHLTEMNDAAGNLARVVAGQERAYVRKHKRAREAKKRARVKEKAGKKSKRNAGRRRQHR